MPEYCLVIDTKVIYGAIESLKAIQRITGGEIIEVKKH